MKTLTISATVVGIHNERPEAVVQFNLRTVDMPQYATVVNRGWLIGQRIELTVEDLFQMDVA